MLGLTNRSGFHVDAEVKRYVMSELFVQPYSHYIISYMLGFLMIFRVQLSYQRYWDGVTNLTESLNRLNCAAGMVIAFDEVAEGEVAIRGFKWREHMMHLFSLLAGFMIGTALRGRMEAPTIYLGKSRGAESRLPTASAEPGPPHVGNALSTVLHSRHHKEQV